MIWWRDRPNEFERFKRELEEFESLKYSVVNEQIIVSGSWAVFGETKLITRYSIAIYIPANYPIDIPKVFETGGALKRIPDNHINHDGSACLFAEPERFEKWPPGATFRDFLNGPVKEFFFSQAFHQMTGKWPFGERKHGDLGLAEYYLERLETDEVETVIELLKIDTKEKFLRQAKCPCNKRNRLLKCHGPKLMALKGIIPTDQIDKDLKSLQNLIVAMIKIGSARKF